LNELLQGVGEEKTRTFLELAAAMQLLQGIGGGITGTFLE
jgi:hypothetical protein